MDLGSGAGRGHAVVEPSVNDGVAIIRFRRPERLNALDLAMTSGFRSAVEAVLGDPTSRVVVLLGEGRSFMAGGDLSYLRANADRGDAARTLIAPIHQALVSLHDSGLPVLAGVQGPVAGAGMSVALFADLVVAAEDLRLSLAYLKVGAPPDCGGSWSLVRLVGPRRAMEIALLGEAIDADRALALGLVTRVTPLADMEATVLTLAARIAAGPPQATRATKRLVVAASGDGFADHLAAELEAFATCARTEDFDEAMEAFAAKRATVFTGR